MMILDLSYNIETPCNLLARCGSICGIGCDFQKHIQFELFGKRIQNQRINSNLQN
jgi:hypothetical protein